MPIMWPSKGRVGRERAAHGGAEERRGRAHGDALFVARVKPMPAPRLKPAAPSAFALATGIFAIAAIMAAVPSAARADANDAPTISPPAIIDATMRHVSAFS